MEGKGFNGQVTYVDSIECIYVATADQIVELSSLCSTLKNVWNSEFKMEVAIGTGDVVAFEIDNSNHSFVRAKVENVYEEHCTSDALLEVHLIDNGEIYMTERSKCVKLTGALQNEPEPCVHKVKLRIPFVNELDETTRHMMNSLLKDTLKKGEKVKVQYDEESNDDDLSLAVVTKINGNVVVNDVLQTLLKHEQLTEIFQSNMLLCDSDLLEEDNVNKAVSGYDPKDEARVCKLFQSKGFCDRKNCRKEHEALNPDGWTSDKEAVFCKSFSDDMDIQACPGDYLVILVTAWVRNSTNCFFGHILNCKSGETQIDWHDLIQKLEKHSKLQMFEVLPALGEAVIAKSENKFFRARVVDIIDEGVLPKATVFCVDYGFEREVPFDQVWKMTPELLHSPFQAIQFLARNLEFQIPEGREIEAICESINPEQNVEVLVQGILSSKSEETNTV